MAQEKRLKSFQATRARNSTVGHLVRVITLLTPCATLVGCVHSDLPYNERSQQRLRLDSRTPEAYTVQAADKAETPVGADGRVIVDVPQIGRGHKTYLFGVAKVKERSAEDNPAVSVKRNGRTVRKLSLSELSRLSPDSEGYRLVKVE
ncbi:MAG TPA: hypothetical protein VGW37_18525 [Terriglobia bacterium]|nr:hypothetical protein [Terriglobia bacterium]